VRKSGSCCGLWWQPVNVPWFRPSCAVPSCFSAGSRQNGILWAL
jgi:hypothetical protein